MDAVLLRKQLYEQIDKIVDLTVTSEINADTWKQKLVAESQEKNKIISELNQSLQEKQACISEKDEQIVKMTREYNKTKTDYETIINQSQQKIQELQTEEDTKSRHDMIKSQAKLIDEKDHMITILNQKITRLDSQLQKKETITEEQIQTKLNEEINQTTSDISPEPEPEPIISETTDDGGLDTSFENESSEANKEKSSESESEDDEVWIQITYKKKKYILVKDETPQYIYEITENKTKGKRLGTRTIVNGRKKYQFDL